jgi:membrane-bound lytic murein transglycosylase B
MAQEEAPSPDAAAGAALGVSEPVVQEPAAAAPETETAPDQATATEGESPEAEGPSDAPEAGAEAIEAQEGEAEAEAAEAEPETDVEPAEEESRTAFPIPRIAPARPPTFAEWLADFRARAVESGRPEAVVDQVLADLEPIERVIELDRDQPEFVRPVWDYLDSAVSTNRVARGRTLADELAPLLGDLRERYGVDAPYLLAIWALESYYGGNIGNFDAAQSMATLAWEGRRREQFETELLIMMDIIASGAARRADFVSGWAGALGQIQFMPSTFNVYAVDHDGDGRKDIWTNRADALASAANYIEDLGWRAGEPWGVEVSLPEGFDFSIADDRRRSVAAWAMDGAVRTDGEAWSAAEQAMEAKLLLPAGATGPAFLTFSNFDVFRRYNTPTNYALAAGMLGDAIAERPGVEASWPRHERPLTREEIEELQGLLSGLGYDTRGVDGRVGPNTRAALRAFQADREMKADAFATAALLERARSDAGARN